MRSGRLSGSRRARPAVEGAFYEFPVIEMRSDFADAEAGEPRIREPSAALHPGGELAARDARRHRFQQPRHRDDGLLVVALPSRQSRRRRAAAEIQFAPRLDLRDLFEQPSAGVAAPVERHRPDRRDVAAADVRKIGRPDTGTVFSSVTSAAILSERMAE